MQDFYKWLEQREKSMDEGVGDWVQKGMNWLGGQNQQQPAQQQQPVQQQQQPAQQTKVFQFDQRGMQNADAFVEQIFAQISKVLGPAYIGGLQQKRGGTVLFKQALKRFWGSASNSAQAHGSMQDTNGAAAMTQKIATIANDVLNSR
jgi:hypothetical protein